MQRWNNSSPLAEKLRNLFRGPNPQFDPNQFSPLDARNKEVEFQACTCSTFKNHAYNNSKVVILENATAGGNATGRNGK